MRRDWRSNLVDEPPPSALTRAPYGQIVAMLLVWLVGLAVACGDGNAGSTTGPPPPSTPPPSTPPPTGSLRVTASTGGHTLDPDGYTIQLDAGLEFHVPINVTVELTDIEVGDHVLSISGIAPNCVNVGPDTRSVNISAGVTTAVRFSIECELDLPGRIAFRSGRDGNREIYVMNADGSNQTRLTNNPSLDDDPTFSPDGSKIAFGSGRDFNDQIYMIGTDGSNLTNITNSPSHHDGDPSWSPDGLRIAFSSGRDEPGNGDVYVMNLDGSGVVRLTTHPAGDGDPIWSPDGTRIAFLSYRSGNEDIWIMDADGSNKVQVTVNEAPDRYPAWSPDGTHIAFASVRDSGQEEVYIINLDGSDPVNLSKNPGIDAFPTWSPDGKYIAFLSTRAGDHAIWVMGADGSDPVSISTHPAGDTKPVWGLKD